MKRKLFIKILFVLVFSISIISQAFAVPQEIEKAQKATVKIDASQINDEEAEIIKKFSLRDKFQRSPETQIRNFYKDFNKYSENNDIEKLKSLYADDFINNDGFNKKTVFEMITKAQDAYKDIEYTTTIENIVTDGKYASVDIHEAAVGTTTKKQEQIDDYGLVASDITYTDYLKKDGNKWKISSSVVKSEKVALKYGETKNMPIEITAPRYVPEGSSYDVTIKTDAPNGVLVLGSIVNEPIVLPQVQNKDVFKSIKSGLLERVLKANTDGNNEYAAVTVGITRATIEPPDVVFTMTGMAFLMSRVNVLHKNNFINKETEESNDAK